MSGLTGVVLAAGTGYPAGVVVRAIQDSKVSPGVLGFLIVAALGVATWLLVRSMTRQLRRIDFDEDAVDRERRAVDEPDQPANGPETPPAPQAGDQTGEGGTGSRG